MYHLERPGDFWFRASLRVTKVLAALSNKCYSADQLSPKGDLIVLIDLICRTLRKNVLDTAAVRLQMPVCILQVSKVPHTELCGPKNSS